MPLISPTVGLAEIYLNGERKCKIQCCECGRAPTFCVAGVREDIFYATQKDIFQTVNEEDLGKVPNTLVLGFAINVMV